MADELGWFQAFRLLAAMWIRATMTYRTSFALMTLSQFLSSLVDFAAILVMFTNISSLGGFDLPEIALLYGVSSLGLAVSDLIFGNCERVGRRVRDGSFDTMLIRPISPLVQIATDDFSLRRVGRIVQAVSVLGWAVWAVDVDWSVLRVIVLLLAMVSGTAIFSAVFVLGGALQFWAQDSAEVANAFTYGGNYLTQYPLTIYPGHVVKAITFLVPIAFVNWYPVLFVLGRGVPGGLPDALRFASPVVALLMCLLAAAVWRTGVRRYRSTGS